MFSNECATHRLKLFASHDDDERTDGRADDEMDGSQQNPEAVMHQVKAELANAYAQEFFSTVRDKCFAKCVTKPGRGMSSGESDCLGKCADRYVEATKMISQVVLRAYSEGGV